MSLTDLYVLGGSAAVIALMVGAAYLLGFRSEAEVSEEELRRLLSDAEPGARFEAIAISADRRAALARLADGRVAVARKMADRLTLRTLPPSAVKLRLQEGGVIATFADMGFPPLRLTLNGAPPAWLAELAARPGAGS